MDHDTPSRALTVVPFALFACAVTALTLSLAWFQTAMHPAELMRDALATATSRAHRGVTCCSPFLGAVSTLGVWLWASTAAISFTGAVVLWVRRADGVRIAMLASAGLLSLWLALDDGFMLHEKHGIKVIGDLGLYRLVSSVLLSCVILCILKLRAFAGVTVLAAALGMLVMSLTIDDYLPQSASTIFVEDSFKFFGICLWTAFFMFKSVEFQCAVSRIPGSSGAAQRPVGTGALRS